MRTVGDLRRLTANLDDRVPLVVVLGSWEERPVDAIAVGRDGVRLFTVRHRPHHRARQLVRSAGG